MSNRLFYFQLMVITLAFSSLKMLLQFGPSKIKELLRFQENLLYSSYVRGSLKNIDLNNDGQIDGYCFRLRTIPIPAYFKDIKLEVDGKLVDKSLIELIIDDKVLRGNEISAENPLNLIPGQPVEVRIRCLGGLERGRHNLSLTLQVRDASRSFLRGEVTDVIR